MFEQTREAAIECTSAIVLFEVATHTFAKLSLCESEMLKPFFSLAKSAAAMIKSFAQRWGVDSTQSRLETSGETARR